MCLGYHGVISVTANAHPTIVSAMCESIINKEFDNALRIHNHLYKINTALFLDVNPICIKFYLNLLNKNVGTPRQPLTLPSNEIQNILKEVKIEYDH